MIDIKPKPPKTRKFKCGYCGKIKPFWARNLVKFFCSEKCWHGYLKSEGFE